MKKNIKEKTVFLINNTISCIIAYFGVLFFAFYRTLSKIFFFFCPRFRLI